ncbi:hypothetical protein BDV06DRAFT_217652 [Aspergillus oleicola]
MVKVIAERFQTPLYSGNHNHLVTVFLRKLEYYEGVLFLITNHVMEFDKAVLSRVYLKIKYPELTQDAWQKIWESFLLEASTSQGPAIIKIKNLTSITQALALVEKTQVMFKHLAKATKANNKFVEEFNKSGRMDSIYI